MLLALVTNNLLYPINYVTAENSGDVEIIGTSIENKNLDVELDIPVSDDILDLKNPENVLEENWNNVTLSWDNEELTWNDSILSWDNEEPTRDDTVLNWNESSLTPSAEDFTWNIEESIWGDESWKSLDELERIRETLNDTEISGQETYKKVTVNVQAPLGIFPEGVELRISPITTKSEIREIKEQIVDSQSNIEEEPELVAFDIAFLYTLSDWTEVELQPKDGESVQVTFDYSNNKTFKKAEADDNQTIEVYHINDKNENGETVEKIEINQVASTEVDNGLVINAESFSVYVLVLSDDDTITLTLDPWEWSILSGENITINEETWTWTILSEGGNVTLPLAIRENHEFLWWYTAWEIFAGSWWNSYEITGDITLYAKWNNNNMKKITYDFGSLNFNGSTYLNTNLKLFSGNDQNRNFDIHMSIDSMDWINDQSKGRNIILNLLDEIKDKYYWFTLYWKDKSNFVLEYRQPGEESTPSIPKNIPQTFDISRINNELFVNGTSYVTYENTTHDYPLTIWAWLDENKNVWRYMSGTLPNINISLHYNKDETITLPEPYRPAMIFSGWYTTPDYQEWTKITSSTLLNSWDIRLYPKWICEKYGLEESECVKYRSVTYHANWWTFSGGQSIIEQVYHTWDTIIQPENPSGSVEFLWWYDEWLKNKFDFSGVIVEDDLDLYAKWDGDWTLTLNPNGWTIITWDNDETQIDENWTWTRVTKFVTLPNVYRDWWYTFLWWYDTNWQKIWDAGYEFELLTDTSLVAHWLLWKHITFNYGDISFKKDDYLDTKLAMFTQANSGLNFNVSFDWNKSTLATKVGQDTIVSSMSEAGAPYPWFVFRYKNGNAKNIQIGYNKSTDNKIEKDYLIANLGNSISIAREDQQLIFNWEVVFADISNTPIFNDTIWIWRSSASNWRYIQWDLSNIKIWVFYDITNGVSIPLLAPIREKDVFRGWYTTPDFQDETDIAIGSDIRDLQTYTLYAKWWRYITYDANGWTFPTTETGIYIQNVQNAKTWAVPENPEREWYIFTWWYLTGLAETFNFNNPVTSDWTVYAKYVCDEENWYLNNWNGECVQWKYTITWSYKDLQWNQTWESVELSYGIVPNHENPVDYVENNRNYIFSGWRPEPVAATESTWYTAEYRAWDCVTNYHLSGENCVSNDDIVIQCNTGTRPANSIVTIWTFVQRRTGTWFLPETKEWTYNWEECWFTCDTNYHRDWSICTSDSGVLPCDATWTPENASPTIINVPVTWNWSWWTEPTACEWNCNATYHKLWDTCVSNDDLVVNCDSTTRPANTVITAWTFVQKWTWTWFLPETKEWTYNWAECWFACATNYSRNWSACVNDNWQGGQWNGSSSTNSSHQDTFRRDRCPRWDYSDSYYDWDCWVSIDDEIWHTHWSAAWEADTLYEYYNSYEWAYTNKIIWKTGINIDWFERTLTRIETARLLSNFAMNVLWMVPDESRTIVFKDVSRYLDKSFNESVSMAYKLWIMWINMPKNRFIPFGVVSRAEFVTALSRMMYWTVDWTDIYYSTHINLMNDLWVIQNVTPDMKETLWYVLIMLKRASDLRNLKN